MKPEIKKNEAHRFGDESSSTDEEEEACTKQESSTTTQESHKTLEMRQSQEIQGSEKIQQQEILNLPVRKKKTPTYLEEYVIDVIMYTYICAPDHYEEAINSEDYEDGKIPWMKKWKIYKEMIHMN